MDEENRFLRLEPFGSSFFMSWFAVGMIRGFG